MSAFAAVLTRDGVAASGAAESGAVAAVLAATAGSLVRTWHSAGCELLHAPLHRWEASEPIVLGRGRIATVGQVTLEARDGLARTLRTPADAPDLEVVAAAFDRWGTDCSRRLRGEYAYVVWHADERRLTCARDPLGIRPLYVGSSAGVVVVSNVIDAVVAHSAIPCELDDAALARFLARGTLTSTVATPYRSVRMVPDGHTLTVASSGAALLTRHWHPAAGERSRERSDEALLAEYRDVLRSAMRDRIGNRRCTIFLSGGMDSTSLAVAGIECASELRALTFSYRQHAMPVEVALATNVADHLGIPLDLVDGDADVALEAERAGEGPALPVDEPSLTNWRAGLRAAAAFSTLAVYGEDGDALFAPPGGAALLAAQPLASVLRATAASVLTRTRLPYLGIRLRERLGLAQLAEQPFASWLTPDARRLADAPEDPMLFGQPMQPPDVDPHTGRVWARLLHNVPRSFAIAISPDVTRQQLALTLPLMDTRVIEFVMSVPPIPWRQDKRLARVAFANHLPASVLTRPKTSADGLHAAMVGRWRRQRMTAAVRSISAGQRPRGWIDEARWADAVAHGSPEATMAAWRVLLLEAWLARAPRRGVPCIG